MSYACNYAKVQKKIKTPTHASKYICANQKQIRNMISIIFEDQGLIVGNLDDNRAGNGVVISNSSVGAS